MPRPPRARVVFVALALGTLGLGLLVHARAWEMPEVVRDKLGDGLWATMVVWWVGVLVPRAPVWSRSLAALAFCWTVEVSQLWHAPWLEAARATTLGGVVDRSRSRSLRHIDGRASLRSLRTSWSSRTCSSHSSARGLTR